MRAFSEKVELGNMVIFRTRATVEHFVKKGPFVAESLDRSFALRDWNVGPLP
jgi:hypothetical protein